MNSFFDALEAREPAQRHAEQMRALAAQIAHAKSNAPAYRQSLRDVDAQSITSFEALQSLPITRKSELKSAQEASPPFGGFAAAAPHAMGRLFQSPGPIYEPEGRTPNFWRTARAMSAAGFVRGDIVHNAFSYHLTPAGSMMESGALTLGCAVIPAGTGQTELQLQAIEHYQPTAYAGTPSFLRILLEKAELARQALSFRKAFVSAEALPPSLRSWFAERGLSVCQMFGTADLGLLAYESRNADGTLNPGMIVDEEVILELVYPGTGDPVPVGEVGEIVVTTLNPDYPLIRFATGDMTALLPGISPCGRTNLRIKGWMGRADQTTKVRGMFVQPAQVVDIMKRHASIKHARLVVSGEMAQDQLSLHCEGLLDGEREAVAASVREITKLRADVVVAEVGALPRDGKLIEDLRSYA